MVIRVPGSRSTQAGSYAELDDRMLVLDFQAGQVEAFVEIHHRYVGLTRHVCGRFLQSQQDVDEALQETWIRVFQGLHRFNGRYALRSWVSRIATNVSLDLLRAHARRPQLDAQPIDEHEREDGSDGPEEEVEKLIQRDMVIAVLAGLPDTHRRALVLRELEGHSHKEIGAELEMTPAQAKALIHRAKGTFRREWLRAATERHGLAGFFLIPILWLSKLGGVARRFADRAGEVAHVGGTDVLTQAGQVASTPIVPVAASGVGEKIIAAGLTLIVAGGVTVGAATIARHRTDERAVAPAAPAAVAAPDDQVREPDAPVIRETSTSEAGTARSGRERGQKGDGDALPVIIDPSPAPSETPSPTPEPSPPPSPSPEPPPTPVIPPAPAWTGSFAIAWASDDLCGCGPGVDLLGASSEGSLLPPDGTLHLEQRLGGAALDAEGDAAWGLDAYVRVDLTASDGSLSMTFTLSRDGEETYFAASGRVSQVSGDLAAGSPVTFSIAGTYTSVGVATKSPIRASGSLSAVVEVWADGTTGSALDIRLTP